MQDERNRSDFKKRVYTLAGFFRDVACLLRSMPALLDALRSGRISPAFMEKVNMAVIGVLGCRYCTWLHSEIALAQGVAEGDLRQLLSQELGDFPEAEAVALAFAQHYSETGGAPHPEAQARFHAAYDRKTARDILLCIRIIYLGNLSGNTLDALLCRLRAQPVPGSSLFCELVVFLLLGPYFFLILPVLTQCFRFKRLSGGKRPA